MRDLIQNKFFSSVFDAHDMPAPNFRIASFFPTPTGTSINKSNLIRIVQILPGKQAFH